MNKAISQKYSSISEYALNSTIEAQKALDNYDKRCKENESKRWKNLSLIEKINENMQVLNKRITKLENKKNWWQVWK